MTQTPASASLSLPGDVEPDATRTIDAYLDAWAGNDAVRQGAARAVLALVEASRQLAPRLARGALPGDPAKLIGVNADGDKQKALDVATDVLFTRLLIDAGVAAIVSEEADEPVPGAPGGKVAVAVDPVDGSGNIGVGAPLGTLFSIVPVEPGKDPFKVTGRSQVAAGYISYGHTIDMGLTVGKGTVIATFDAASGNFLIVDEKRALPKASSDLAFNSSNHRHWQPGVRAFVEDAYAGKDGPLGRNFNQRWIGAAVGDAHRIMVRGGLFFYVGDRRKGYENGRLRLLYEAWPLAFLFEQAGGAATDGVDPILDIQPGGIHDRSPLVFGSAEEVELFRQYSLRDRAVTK